MSDYPGRIMTKASVLPSTTQASGIWTLQQALQAIKAGVWPGIPTNTVVLSFTSSGSWTCPDGVSQVDYLVVAGGGGGGLDIGGGGGAGGFRTGTSFPVIPGTTYTITVGSGGAGGAGSSTAVSGGNSIFSSVTSNGGGSGGSRLGSSPYPNYNGANGGSGGGGSASGPGPNGTGGTGNTPSTSP